MAFSKPVVGTAIGGRLSRLSKGKPITCSSKCPHEMAEAIGKLIEDQPLRTSMGLSIASVLETSFS